MRTGRVTAAIRRAIVAATLVGYLAGCTGWHEISTLTPAPETAKPKVLRVTLKDGSRLELRDAQIMRDSIVGQGGEKPNQVRTAIALSEVKQIADWQGGGTGGAIVGGFIGILLVAVIVGAAAGSSIHTGFGGN